MTRVTPCRTTAGSWKQSDLPAPVGIDTKQSCFACNTHSTHLLCNSLLKPSKEKAFRRLCNIVSSGITIHTENLQNAMTLFSRQTAKILLQLHYKKFKFLVKRLFRNVQINCMKDHCFKLPTREFGVNVIEFKTSNCH